MIKIKNYTIDQVLNYHNHLNDPDCDIKIIENKVYFDGDEINMKSQRYALFKKNGQCCVSCGLKGTYFTKEKHNDYDKSYHFNLYGINDKGEEILFSKDHIIPKSLGGKDSIDNYQVMCIVCNQYKGNLKYRGFDRLKISEKDFILLKSFLHCQILLETLDELKDVSQNNLKYATQNFINSIQINTNEIIKNTYKSNPELYEKLSNNLRTNINNLEKYFLIIK